MVVVSLISAFLLIILLVLMIFVVKLREPGHVLLADALLSFLVCVLVVGVAVLPFLYDVAGGGGSSDFWHMAMRLGYTSATILLALVVGLAVRKRHHGIVLSCLVALVLAMIAAFAFWYLEGQCICCVVELTQDDPLPARDLGDCVYFSTVTLTTVGHGNVVPFTTLGKALASIEGLLGYILLGVFVAALSRKMQ